MDFNDTNEEAKFRAEARKFLEANVQPKSADAERLQRKLSPKEYLAAAKDYQRKKAEAEAHRLGVSEICVIGGGVIYEEAMATADVLHVTHIGADIDGDTFFPEIASATWEAVETELVPAGEKDDFPTRYVIYRRRA